MKELIKFIESTLRPLQYILDETHVLVFRASNYELRRMMQIVEEENLNVSLDNGKIKFSSR